MPRMISGAAQAAANAAAADAADALAAADAATPPTVTPPTTTTTTTVGKRTFIVQPKKGRKGSEDPRTFKEWAEVSDLIKDAVQDLEQETLSLPDNGIRIPDIDTWRRVDKIVSVIASETDSKSIGTPPDQTAVRAEATGDFQFLVSIGRKRSAHAIALRVAARAAAKK